MFNLQQLKVLILLAEFKKLTPVAEKMNIKQPSVTFHMKKLEESAGVPLFITKHKMVFLTEEGKTLLHYANRIVSWADEAERVLADYRQFKKGTINLGASNTPATYFLPKLIVNMRETYPHVDIFLKVKNSPRIINMIKTFEIDFGFIAENMVDDPELIATSFAKDELGLTIHPDHPFAQMESIKPEMLQNEYWLMREKGSSTRRMTDFWANQNGIDCNRGIEFGSTEAIKHAITSKLGVAILSRIAVDEEVNKRQLVFKSLFSPELTRNFYLIYNRNRLITPLFYKYIEFFKNIQFFSL